MPVEIRELQITTVVQDTSAQTPGSASSGSQSNQDKIIEACVEQVLEILKQKNER
jgi:hypothetical protein